MIKSIREESRYYMQEHHFSGHDFSHITRVHKLCQTIGKIEGADMLVLEAAALLHDLGREEEKKNPKINHAEKSAEIAEGILQKVRFSKAKIPSVLYAIKTHRFSKGIVPTSLEAKILQDADRIDIIGAIGVAMTFAYGGAYNRDLYDPYDPFAKNRELDDRKYSLDHFKTKLLNLIDTLHTDAARKVAKKRSRFVKQFLKEFKKEIEGI